VTAAISRAQTSDEVAKPHPQATDEVPRPQFGEWLNTLREAAGQRGISTDTLDRALNGLEPLPVVIERDRTQRELTLTVQEYVEQRVTRGVIRTARTAAAKHRALLRRVERQYGVPAQVIVAIWGLESNFGRFSGVRPTIQSLATLAWEGRRAGLFREQLLVALGILDRGEVDFDRLRGSWAGAMGQVQFLPSSYVAYAQDFDGDGRKDIWRSTADVFASMAYYLQANGWQRGRPWGVRVTRPGEESDSLRALAVPREKGCSAEKDLSAPAPLSTWRKAGVRPRTLIRNAKDEYSLLTLGRASYLVTSNYEALLAYNCAHSYAMSVAQLGDAIAAPPAKVTRPKVPRSKVQGPKVSGSRSTGPRS
jgi:membrane-bound lytic murein transglycosylase B